MLSAASTGATIGFIDALDIAAAQLFWFVDKAHVGTAPPHGDAPLDAEAGTFTARVVDDKGRTDSRLLNVTVVE